MEAPLPVLSQLCPHLDECKGCPTMKMPYVQQCERKHQGVKQVLQYYVEEVGFVPATSLQFYRNRADYWYDPAQQLGFRKASNSYEGFASPSCQLMSSRAQKAYSFLAPKLKELNFLPYSVLEQKGYLRYVIFRESKSKGQLVIVLYTFTQEKEKEMETLANEMLSQQLVDGIVWIHAPKFNDNAEGEIYREWGNTLILETLNGIPFSYNANCFFQTNPKMAEKLQQHVVSLVPENNTVLDLYCGVGLFSIPLITKGNLVKGIELGKESIIFARKNAHALRLNDDQFSFEVGDVPKKIQEFEKKNETFDTIILDPPRAGLSKKIWRRLLRLKPNHFVYVSCNLSALQRDLEWLMEYAEFTITKATAFDLFPHTDHVETVVDIQVNLIKEFPKGG